mmetsp:Transcript_9674/g.24601  ORF Transcript_9674/g.24601 Transcript_9674/m.24601 type:complete len:206 (+) Transcript_9674:1724-2341(+)
MALMERRLSARLQKMARLGMLSGLAALMPISCSSAWLCSCTSSSGMSSTPYASSSPSSTFCIQLGATPIFTRKLPLVGSPRASTSRPVPTSSGSPESVRLFGSGLMGSLPLPSLPAPFPFSLPAPLLLPAAPPSLQRTRTPTALPRDAAAPRRADADTFGRPSGNAAAVPAGATVAPCHIRRHSGERQWRKGHKSRQYNGQEGCG